MSNNNDHSRPDEGGNGGSNGWTAVSSFAQLLSSVFQWMGRTDSQREIQQAKDQNLDLELKKAHQHAKDQQAMALMQKIWETEAMNLLNELERGLMERQDAYCSRTSKQKGRLDMEENRLLKLAQKPLAQELNIEDDLKFIFRNDSCCARFTNKDKRKNGCLMWGYLKYWELQVKQQKEQKRAERSMGTTQPDQDQAGSRTRT